MRLFLVGWHPEGRLDQGAGGQAMGEVLERLPYFDAAAAETWVAPSGRLTLTSVGHEPERVGGVSYQEADADGVALWSGRPIRWSGEASADGRAPLDPGFYRRPAREWAGELDGRCAALRYDDRRGELELYTDPLGSYPLYVGGRDRTRWFSNSADLVRAALGGCELDTSVTASLVRFGYSLSGRPLWAGVRRLPRGAIARMSSSGADSTEELLPLGAIVPEGEFEARRAADALVALTGALADWPGRPARLQISGGRDSRLILSAALRSGAEFEAVTTGDPDHPDARAARELCERTGARHRMLPPEQSSAMTDRVDEAGRIIGGTSAGAFSLEDAAGYPLDRSEGPLPIWMGGQGGEISRRHYARATGSDADELARSLSGEIRESVGLLNAHGCDLALRQMREAVSCQLGAGVPPGRVPELFYLLGRMGNWAATGFGCVEYAKGDSVSPLWSVRMLPHQLRAAALGELTFHDELLTLLAPELDEVPYASSGAPRIPGSSVAAVVEEVARAAAEQPSHPAWDVLDRDRVEALLGRRPAELEMSEIRGVWRLATVFMGAGAGATVAT